MSGGDNIFDILLDAGDILKTPLGKFLSTNELAKKALRAAKDGLLVFPRLPRNEATPLLPATADRRRSCRFI